MKIYSKNSSENKTITKTSTYSEYSTPKKKPNFSFILPKKTNYLIYFPINNENDENYDGDLENEENERKINLKKNSIKKIFNMMNIPYKNISPFIEFSYSYIKSETVTNTITTFNLDYRTIFKFIDNLNIQFENNDEDLEINKKSMNKIFNLIGLPANERLNLMQFYQVDEDIVYEEEEEDDVKTNKKSNKKSNKTYDNYKSESYYYHSAQNKSTKMKSSLKDKDKDNKEFYYTPNKLKTKNNKIKIINTGNEPFTSDKLKKSPMDKLFNLVNNIPSLINKIKNNKDEIKHSKKLLVEGKLKKIHSRNVDTKILTVKSLEERILTYEKPIQKYRLKEKPIKKDEPHQKTTVALRVRSRSIKNKPNICVYPFILRKKPEYGDITMYLTGSLPQLGNFNPKLAIPMDEEMRNNQIFYTKYIDIKREEFPFDYKYFYIKDDNIIWVGTPYRNYKTHPQFFRLFHTMKKSIISILDLNIRYLNDIDGVNVWDLRKESFIQCLLNSYADIFFFQEITHTQYDYIDENLNSVYEFVGIYRDSTDKSEKCSISYNIFKYTLIDWGQFWLSSTPYIPGSNDFHNFFPRICTWAALKQINGIELIFFNIHLDHVNFDAHLPCINVALEESEKILQRFPEIQFVFLGGCFYCEEDDIVIDRIKRYDYEEVMFENTFHDFTGEADRHWDYLFWKERNHEKNIIFKRAIVPKKDSTISEEKKQYISDHYPCYAEFKIQQKGNVIGIGRMYN